MNFSSEYFTLVSNIWVLFIPSNHFTL